MWSVQIKGAVLINEDDACGERVVGQSEFAI